MRPVCLKCHVQMKAIKNGAIALDCHERQEGTVDLAKVYQVWSTDVYECTPCGARIIGAYGQAPIFQEHQVEEIKTYIAEQSARDPNVMVVWFVR